MRKVNCVKKIKETKYIDQLLWRSPPAEKGQTELEQKKTDLFEKWLQEVLWLEANDKFSLGVAVVLCGHTLENCNISWSQRSLLRAIPTLRGQASAV